MYPCEVISSVKLTTDSYQFWVAHLNMRVTFQLYIRFARKVQKYGDEFSKSSSIFISKILKEVEISDSTQARQQYLRRKYTVSIEMTDFLSVCAKFSKRIQFFANLTIGMIGKETGTTENLSIKVKPSTR